jgi:cell division protein FtsZ
MNIKLQLPKLMHLRPRITVIGVGGAGSNAVNNMIASGLAGVSFVVANTDAQSLANSSAEHRIQLGAALTEGLGAGARPEIGAAAAEEACEEIRTHVAGSHMVFVAAGMGGGTGTGAAAVIARIARECGALTVGVVTKPFHFEGTKRMRAAEAGIATLKPEVDTLIVIPNQNLFRIANERTTFAEAFVLADQVLKSGISCVVDLIVNEGLINLDFADVRTIMSGMGTAMMGTGEASGDKRAVLAAEEAISNPLLDDISLRGAKGLLVSITGGRDLKLYEVDEAATRVRQEVEGEANIIVGATFDETLGDRIRVSIVASGMERIEAGGAHGALLSDVKAIPAAAPPSLADLQPPPLEPFPDPYVPGIPEHVAPSMREQIGGPFGSAGGFGASYDEVRSAPPHHAPTSYSGLPGQQHPDFARALSEALESLPGDAQNPAATGNAAPATTWTSGGGAVFEEAPANVGQDRLASLGQSAGHRNSPQWQDQMSHPQPQGVAVPAGRRLPQVEDFPAVGQREYHAKSVQYGEQPPPPPRAYDHPPPVEEPRPGFFARLFGRKRKRRNEAPAEQSYPEALPTRSAEQTAPPATAHHRQAASQGQSNRRQQEHVEIPAFFGSDRR